MNSALVAFGKISNGSTCHLNEKRAENIFEEIGVNIFQNLVKTVSIDPRSSINTKQKKHE